MLKTRLLAAITAIILVISYITVFAAEKQANTLWISVPESAKLEETLTADIMLSKAKIAGGKFTLTYDSTLLELISAASGAALTNAGVSAVINSDETGVCKFTFANTNDLNIDGSIMSVSFKAKAEGKADFKFSDVSFSDLAGIISNTDYNVTALDSSIILPSALEGVRAVALNDNSICFFAGVDSLEYSEVGFILSTNDKVAERTASAVYKYIEDINVSAADIDKEYIYAFTVSDIPDKDTAIIVSQYAKDTNGNKITSQTTSFTLSDLLENAAPSNT